MSYVALATERFDEMAQFYGGLLGLPIVDSWDRDGSRGRRFHLGGGLRLELLDNLRERSPLRLAEAADRLQIVIEVADVAGAWSRLPVGTPQPVLVSWGAKLFSLRDPDGVPVTYLQWIGSPGVDRVKRIIVGISGATGAIYGIRLLEVLRAVPDVESHLVLSPAARRTVCLETDWSVEQVEALADHTYRPGDIAASISSGSFRSAGMVVAPCSIRTLSGIATSFSDNLLLRAADVILKERRRLVLLVRETPLHLGHLRLLVQVAEMGAVVMPPVPAFYHRPATLQAVIDQTVNRTLDLLDIELEQDLFPRWQGPAL